MYLEYFPLKGRLSVAVGFGLVHNKETDFCNRTPQEFCGEMSQPTIFSFSRTKEKAGYNVLRRNLNCSSWRILTFEALMDSGELSLAQTLLPRQPAE
jgi:hypothetical protein